MSIQINKNKIILLSFTMALLHFTPIFGQKILSTNFNKGIWEQVDKGLQRKWVSGKESTFAVWKMDKGAHVASHQHPNEQVTYIRKGSVKVLMNNTEYIVKAGGVLIIPGGIIHEFFCLEDNTEDIDFFTPVRKDWIEGNASYLSQKSKNLEVVAEFNTSRPGNVAVSHDGRVFATLHPLTNPKQQLVEIVNRKIVAFPSEKFQKNGKQADDDKFDTPLGATVDKQNRLWVIDMGLELGVTRLWCIDLKKNKIIEKIELSQEIAPKGSFVQDLAIDEKNGWAYLADIANPGIIALNLKTKKARRFSGYKVLQAEDADMIIDGKVIDFQGKPARVGINPITLSNDRENIFFGSMNGTSWYKVPSKLFRENADDIIINNSIQKIGDKPVSDGVATDKNGNHYITNLGGRSISKLDSNGNLSELVKDTRLKWPDNIAISEDGYLYVSVNQLNETSAFSGEPDSGKPPYFIYKIKL